VVVGAGLTGITAALLLAEAGCAWRSSSGDGSAASTPVARPRTPTPVVDARLDSLARRSAATTRRRRTPGGRPFSRSTSSPSRLDIDCDLAGFRDLHVAIDATAAERTKERERLRDEAALAQDLEFDARSSKKRHCRGRPRCGWSSRPVSPRKYLRGLLTALRGHQIGVFEETSAEASRDGVTAGSHSIRAPWVVMATHTPLQGRQGFLGRSFDRLAVDTSYVVRAELPEA
jgi:glycine/D-amino acid oxidase-like deaminating enzyme